LRQPLEGTSPSSGVLTNPSKLVELNYKIILRIVVIIWSKNILIFFIESKRSATSSGEKGNPYKKLRLRKVERLWRRTIL